MSNIDKCIFDSCRIVESSDANVKKLVFTKEDSNPAVAEAVLYKYPAYAERTVICCSTQSGCPVGCRFCGAGDFFIRNLSVDEIVYQVDEAISIAESEGVHASEFKRLQIMFMSMGEPMLNWGELKKSLRLLFAAYPNAALLISTMAPQATKKSWDDLIDLSVEIPAIGLQFSVHEAVQEERNKLIPMSKKLSLQEISEMGSAWSRMTGRRPFFNYCVHEKNNKGAHADLLTEYFDPLIWECTLSVICEADEGIAAANQRQRDLVSDFMQIMLHRGHSVRMFDPAGQDDIGGGCGQLWFVQDWADKHRGLKRLSHGSGMDRVHAPTELLNAD